MVVALDAGAEDFNSDEEGSIYNYNHLKILRTVRSFEAEGLNS